MRVVEWPAATINHLDGGMGSSFTVTATHFVPAGQATVTINGQLLGSVLLDEEGQATFRLDTSTADLGAYEVVVAVGQAWERVAFRLVPNGLVHPPAGTGPILVVPAGIAHHEYFLSILTLP